MRVCPKVNHPDPLKGMSQRYKLSKPRDRQPIRFCWGKMTWIKTQGTETKDDNNFKGRCSELEGYVFDIGLISSYKFEISITVISPSYLDWKLNTLLLT